MPPRWFWCSKKTLEVFGSLSLRRGPPLQHLWIPLISTSSFLRSNKQIFTKICETKAFLLLQYFSKFFKFPKDMQKTNSTPLLEPFVHLNFEKSHSHGKTSKPVLQKWSCTSFPAPSKRKYHYLLNNMRSDTITVRGTIISHYFICRSVGLLQRKSLFGRQK